MDKQINGKGSPLEGKRTVVVHHKRSGTPLTMWNEHFAMNMPKRHVVEKARVGLRSARYCKLERMLLRFLK